MEADKLQETLARLYRRNLHTIKLGLDPVRALLEELENPQDRFLAVHVAGTNGKGSVSALIESILRAAGLRTGLYTSPHLVRFNERIRVNGAEIPDHELAALLDEVETATGRMRARTGERDVTFFEFTTAMAFEYFAARRVQVAVIETGLGGRLDATNVLTPLVSVITSIGLDHQQYLGDTLAQIAGEKAGIVKEGRPVIAGELPGEAMEVVAAAAKRHYAPLIRAKETVTVRRVAQDWDGQRVHVETSDGALGTVSLALLGDHQLGNLAIATAAVLALGREMNIPFDNDAFREGIATAAWPGRCQVLSREPPVLLDGAHNPEAAAALARTLRQLGHKLPWAGVAGFLSDKDAAAIVRPFASFLRELWIVGLDTDRAMPPHNAIDRLHGLPVHPRTAPRDEAIAAATAWARRNGGGVILFGSLYLVAEVLARR